MAAAILMWGRGFHQVDELIAELDKSVARPFAPEREVEDLAVEIESLVDVADFEGDVVDADKPRLLGIGLAGLAHLRPSCWFVPCALPIYVNARPVFPGAANCVSHASTGVVFSGAGDHSPGETEWTC